MTVVLADRVAVVTGGASGIGRATVLRFLEAGRLRYVPTNVSVESNVAALIETSEAEDPTFAAHPGATILRFPMLYRPNNARPHEWPVVRPEA
jgi:NAD(P)-dependent dehydrogenase (short-subunit alcohol dehydrogenase family)